ncbi:hypothetical protein BTVI_37657 [Pitangus sulphuratus]|nr:hypothetical protein BTVI_37657 [Pitangus sulphuratus]
MGITHRTKDQRKKEKPRYVSGRGTEPELKAELGVSRSRIEYSELEGTHEDHRSPTPIRDQYYSKNHTRCLTALSEHLLSSTLGSLFQCPNTLWVKNLFPTPTLTLP